MAEPSKKKHARTRSHSKPKAVKVLTMESEYDFIDEPDQDCFCPVSLELLTQPHQTICCGNHISQQAAEKLIQDGQPCPMCKELAFSTQTDKYFKRNSINKLKVYCPHRKSGCEWTGELGDLDKHTTSCPKHPWKCPYCEFESLYEAAIDHAPQCDYHPVPCPNHCEVGTVPRCHAEKHLLDCPLQLVDCEYTSAGCNVRVPRRDLAGHMTESAQHHLMTATLLNLRLTRELSQKMEEKDQQIAELKQQLTKQEQKLTSNLDSKFQKQQNDSTLAMQQITEKMQGQMRAIKQLRVHVNYKTGEVNDRMQQHTKDIKAKLDHQSKCFDAKFEHQTGAFNTKLKEQTGAFNTKLKEQTKHLDTSQAKLEDNLIKRLHFIRYSIGLPVGCFTNYSLTLRNFTVHQRCSKAGGWCSLPFYNHPGGYRLQLSIDTNGSREGFRTHLCAYVVLLPGDYDSELQWPLKVTARLTMLNQQGDYTHHSGPEMQLVFTTKAGEDGDFRCIDPKYYLLSELKQPDDVDIQYLHNDNVEFKLHIKID